MADRAVLKERDILLVSDECGDIASHNSDGHGLYWRDTRFLSLYELKVAGTKPALLSSAGEHNFMNNLQFANSALVDEGGVQLLPARSALGVTDLFKMACKSESGSSITILFR